MIDTWQVAHVAQAIADGRPSAHSHPFEVAWLIAEGMAEYDPDREPSECVRLTERGRFELEDWLNFAVPGRRDREETTCKP